MCLNHIKNVTQLFLNQNQGRAALHKLSSFVTILQLKDFFNKTSVALKSIYQSYSTITNESLLNAVEGILSRIEDKTAIPTNYPQSLPQIQHTSTMMSPGAVLSPFLTDSFRPTLPELQIPPIPMMNMEQNTTMGCQMLSQPQLPSFSQTWSIPQPFSAASPGPRTLFIPYPNSGPSLRSLQEYTPNNPYSLLMPHPLYSAGSNISVQRNGDFTLFSTQYLGHN